VLEAETYFSNTKHNINPIKFSIGEMAVVAWEK